MDLTSVQHWFAYQMDSAVRKKMGEMHAHTAHNDIHIQYTYTFQTNVNIYVYTVHIYVHTVLCIYKYIV